jgi:hypothetical protein
MQQLTKIKWLIGLGIIVLQVAVSHFNYNIAVAVESRLLGLNDPMPLFMPLLLTIAYGIYCKNRILSSAFGFLSWLAFPVVVLVVEGDYPPLLVILPLLLGGFLYALIGFASALIELRVFERKRVGHGSKEGKKGHYLVS